MGQNVLFLGCLRNHSSRCEKHRALKYTRLVMYLLLQYDVAEFPEVPEIN